MQLPATITFRGVESTAALEADIRQRIEKLERYYRPIMKCRVLVEFVQRHHEAGNRYHVRIDLTVPGEEIVVAHEAGLHAAAQDVGATKPTKQVESVPERKHARVAVREAFDVARRRLQDYARRQRGAVKTTTRQPRGRVVRLLPPEAYGFIEAEDGHEVYFHRSSVLNDAFDRLTVGAEVSFAEEAGEKGPQASTVRLTRSRGVRRLPLMAAIALCLFVLSAAASADAQRRGSHHHPVRGAVVFVGGYFYDPFFGPYPWWPPVAYPYPYFPIYDNRAEVRILATPRDAAVYVDGFYAGVVDDFDGFFERLPLPPGGHEIVLYLDTYRTVRRHIYLTPGSTFKLQATMERLPAGTASELPAVAPPVPPPPAGSSIPPRTPPRDQRPVPPQMAGPTSRAACGTLALRVQPAHADVTIDGERWASSDGEQFIVEVPAGLHRIDIAKPGYRSFSTEMQVRDGETVPLNVSLSPERP